MDGYIKLTHAVIATIAHHLITTHAVYASYDHKSNHWRNTASVITELLNFIQMTKPVIMSDIEQDANIELKTTHMEPQHQHVHNHHIIHNHGSHQHKDEDHCNHLDVDEYSKWFTAIVKNDVNAVNDILDKAGK